MIDTWFKEDLQCILEQHPVAVFIDESGEADFLLKSLLSDCTVHSTNGELDELEAKYRIEKALQEHPASGQKFLVYTQLPKDELTFVREYCETNGCIEIRYLQNYIKDKVHQTLNLNINLPKDELITAAKMSVGKDRTYWMDLSHKGSSEIFDLKKELLPFIHDPESYSKDKYDAKLRETFYRKVNDLLGKDYLEKPPATLAGEVVTAMLDGLTNNNCDKILESVYINWLDSVSFGDSFNVYLSHYTLPVDLDIWTLNVNHPFTQVDEKWLAVIGSKITDKTTLPNALARIKQRSQSKQAQALGINFWADVITLLEFDPKDIAYLSSFNECVEFYKKHFCPLDTAIRNLYTEFLHKRDLLQPYQEFYKEHVAVFLDKWFKFFSGYKENQTGTLQRIIDSTSAKIAVIVGDGVAYEIAEQVALKVRGQVSLTRNSILADVPSITENNMSRIYMVNSVVEAVQNKREKYLTTQNPNVAIDYVRLDEVNEEARPGQVLVCTYKDIDDIGDKLNNKALKYFPEAIEFFATKIVQLLSSGYAKVYLITDHGFVLTGLLCESDKISVKPKGESNINERYIWTVEKQDSFIPQLIEVEKTHKAFNYLYFTQNMNPFKTPGLYGFAHGGLAPQELVTPFFCWESTGDGMAVLPVIIDNKEDLADVTGELFQLSIRANGGADDLFSLERKVYLAFFANKTQINKIRDIFTIQSNGLITKEYAFDGHAEIEVQLLDAISKQQLDRAVVRQNKDRDLGGLL